MTPAECTVGPPIAGQLTLEGIPVLGLVDTGASVTCLGFSVWWCYRAQWGPLGQFEGTVHSAHGKPLQIAGKTQHLNLQWGEARGRACFIVIVGLESPPCLIGMDIMRPLRIHIDLTQGKCDPCPARPSDSPPKCSPELAATVAKKWLAHRGSRLSAPKSPAMKENAVGRR